MQTITTYRESGRLFILRVMAINRQQSRMGSASAIEKVCQAAAEHDSNGIESCSGINRCVRGHEKYGTEKQSHHKQSGQEQ